MTQQEALEAAKLAKVIGSQLGSIDKLMIDKLTDVANRRAAAPLEEQMVCDESISVLRNMLANGGSVLPQGTRQG